MHALPFETATQWAGLLVALIAGWLIGLATHPGGRKWRERLRVAEAEQRAYRERTDAALEERAERIRVLEAENTRARAAYPVDVTAPTPHVSGDTIADAERRERAEAARHDAAADRLADVPRATDPALRASDRARPAGDIDRDDLPR